MSPTPDVVIAGGGIAGGALATVLARGNVQVAVLEHDLEPIDRMRGETMAPWGVIELRRLGLRSARNSDGPKFLGPTEIFSDSETFLSLRVAQLGGIKEGSMWKLPLLTAFVAGIGLVSPVIAQNIASLPDAKSSYLVFADRNGLLSPVAIETVRNAANAAGRPIDLSGPAPYVETVKKQLIREGVPATAISVRATTAPSLPATQDGISSPQDRSVKIRF